MVNDLFLEDKQQDKFAPKVSRLQDALLYDMHLPLRATFYPLGFAIEILTNDASVLQAAQESFGHRRLCRGESGLQIRIGVSEIADCCCPPEPTRREYNHLYTLIADNNNHAILDFKTLTSFVWLTRVVVKNRLYLRYNFLEKVVYLLLGASMVTDIHAACISRRKRGILLCGDSGAGKSTLAYACARAGWTYTSDDTSYLINKSVYPKVIGHSHRVRFRPAARDLFPELAKYEATPRMEGKPSLEISTSDLPIVATAVEASIYTVVYLKRDQLSGARLDPLGKGTATKRISQELFSAGEIRARHERILNLLYATPTFELRYRDLDKAIEQLNLLAE
jgi:hypothetical protein